MIWKPEEDLWKIFSERFPHVLQIVELPFPVCVCVCRRRVNWQTWSTHRAHHSTERRRHDLFSLPQSLTLIFPSFVKMFSFCQYETNGAVLFPLYATVDVLIVSAESKTWLDSMRPLLKIIALSDKQNSGENGEKWRNNHQILSRFSSQVGGQQSIGGHCWENVFADRREFILNWGLDRTAPICRPSVQKK